VASAQARRNARLRARRAALTHPTVLEAGGPRASGMTRPGEKVFVLRGAAESSALPRGGRYPGGAMAVFRHRDPGVAGRDPPAGGDAQDRRSAARARAGEPTPRVAGAPPPPGLGLHGSTRWSRPLRPRHGAGSSTLAYRVAPRGSPGPGTSGKVGRAQPSCRYLRGRLGLRRRAAASNPSSSEPPGRRPGARAPTPCGRRGCAPIGRKPSLA